MRARPIRTQERTVREMHPTQRQEADRAHAKMLVAMREECARKRLAPQTSGRNTTSTTRRAATSLMG
jgi:hypothetical protein